MEPTLEQPKQTQEEMRKYYIQATKGGDEQWKRYNKLLMLNIRARVEAAEYGFDHLEINADIDDILSAIIHID